jgi:REP element-mobilizing transposase RayT
MEKREFYRRSLPHFQQPGQAYFITWNLKDAVPAKALLRYTRKLDALKSQINFHEKQKSPEIIIAQLKTSYYSLRKKYIKAYDDLLNLGENLEIDLSKPENLAVITEALHFWEGKKLDNFAYSVMPNHVHWVFKVYKKVVNGQDVFLQDILQSVKRHTANQINKLEGRTGTMWQKESFDTTIRDEEHLYYAINYTLQNPVSAGLVSEWRNWPGCWSGCVDL